MLLRVRTVPVLPASRGVQEVCPQLPNVCEAVVEVVEDVEVAFLPSNVNEC